MTASTAPRPGARPRVSVLVAAFEAERTVGATISSVLEQDYPDVEVVVVDDGSGDGTAQVVAGFERAGLPVRLVRQGNAGPSAARNAALAHATGELVAVLDADDQLLPGYLTTAVDRLRTAGGRTFVSVDAYLLTPGGFDPRRGVLQLGAPPRDRQPRAILEGNFVSIFTVMPRAMLDELGGFDETLRACEDWDLWARAIVRGWRVDVVRERLALYRWTPGSLSTAAERMAAGEMQLLRGLRERDGHLLSAEDLAFLDERIAAGSIMALRKAADDALRAGDVRAARAGYARVAHLSPADRRSAVKARTLGNPVGDRFWRRRLAAADVATARQEVGR